MMKSSESCLNGSARASLRMATTAAASALLALILGVCQAGLADGGSHARISHNAAATIPNLSLPDQLPPPPSLRPHLPAFLPLYASYHALRADAGQPTFSVWLLINGVTDRPTHDAMLLLYVWMERQPSS